MSLNQNLDYNFGIAYCMNIYKVSGKIHYHLIHKQARILLTVWYKQEYDQHQICVLRSRVRIITLIVPFPMAVHRLTLPILHDLPCTVRKYSFPVIDKHLQLKLLIRYITENRQLSIYLYRQSIWTMNFIPNRNTELVTRILQQKQAKGIYVALGH